MHKQYEFSKQTILNDESLTENEKSEAIRIITKTYDLNKLIFNEGTKRICENSEGYLWYGIVDNGSVSASTITWKDLEKAQIKIMEE
ncbi:hypothetical protein RhiirA1_475089 [Rhizophagus irregularis]|uniref:Uncharacterized protein n=1 Tax=Rhizophagus irregularis TaxID=588596 RepID=A0A2N0QXH5_9GLOM|nr:hypothetical protein RhiirA1_475089 [Rhizophagus irregularis]